MRKISIAATGDSIITTRVSVHSEPRFLEMVELLRKADVAFTNLEVIVHDYEEDAYPSPQSGGTYMRASPEMIDELAWMGFDMFSTANNHSLDYMYGGLAANIENLRSAGIPFSGTGFNLAEARSPAYLETSRGRVGLVSAASSFASFNLAGDARRDMKGRPGLNPLRYETYHVVNAGQMETIKKLDEGMNVPGVIQPDDAYFFLGKKFVQGDDVGIHTRPYKGDLEGNLEAIREASRQSDWVLFSHHSHQGRANDDDRPAEFMEETSRSILEAGAHAVMGHGHHAIRGIEIWKDRPIFYCLGNFFFQNQLVMKMPADFYTRYGLKPYDGTPADAFDARRNAPPRPGRPNRYGYPKYKYYVDIEKYWLSFIPFMTFENDKLSSLELYPVELGQTKPRPQRGRPMLAEAHLATKMLEKIKELSEPYGTDIVIGEGVGKVRL
jgi:poly-gamma-glutamate synthesis protein (capsule biosynthesis protein)